MPLCYCWKQEDNPYGYKQVLTSSDIFSNANYIDDKNFENYRGRGFGELYLNYKMFIVIESQRYTLDGSFEVVYSNPLILEMLKLRVSMYPSYTTTERRSLERTPYVQQSYVTCEL